MSNNSKMEVIKEQNSAELAENLRESPLKILLVAKSDAGTEKSVEIIIEDPNKTAQKVKSGGKEMSAFDEKRL